MKLSFSAAFDAGDWLAFMAMVRYVPKAQSLPLTSSMLAFVAMVRYVLFVNIPVAGLYFLDKVTLRAFAIASKRECPTL